MPTFQHPFLIRGVLRLATGAFPISRGRVELPDEVGEPLGWRKIEVDDAEAPAAERSFRGASTPAKTTRDRR
jgi:hypothetical protein